MPRNWWLTLVISVPDGVVRVVTRYWVIRLDARPAGPGCCPPSTAPTRAGIELVSGDHAAAGHLQWASLDGLMTWLRVR